MSKLTPTVQAPACCMLCGKAVQFRDLGLGDFCSADDEIKLRVFDLPFPRDPWGSLVAINRDHCEDSLQPT